MISEDYSYDLSNNLLAKVVTDVNMAVTNYTYGFDASSRLLSSSDGSTTMTFAYDDWKRRMSKTDGTYTTLYSYELKDKLSNVSSTFPGHDTISYTFSGDRTLRSRGITGGSTEWYNWDKTGSILNVEAEGSSTGNGPLLRTHIAKLAQVEGSVPSTGNLLDYLYDGLSSAVALYDDQKALVSESEYFPTAQAYPIPSTSLSFGYFGILDEFAPVDILYDEFVIVLRQQGKVDRAFSFYTGANSRRFAASAFARTSSLGGQGPKCGSGWTADIVPDNPLGFPFAGCCGSHDDCYCNPPRGGNQASCDLKFKDCLLGKCTNLNNMTHAYKCQLLAQSYYGAVNALGASAWNKARSDCNCT